MIRYVHSGRQMANLIYTPVKREKRTSIFVLCIGEHFFGTNLDFKNPQNAGTIICISPADSNFTS